MEMDKTTIMTAIALLMGGGNVYQQQNPMCDAVWEQVEIVREEGKQREILTRDRVMEWVDRTCPSTSSALALYLPYPDRGCGEWGCPEWPCETDRECIDCMCVEGLCE